MTETVNDGDRRSFERAASRNGLEPQKLPYHDRQRGRAARWPIDIGIRGWWDIIVRVFERLGIDNVGLITAGVTFYIYLALIPAVIAVVTFYGLVTDNVTLAAHVRFLSGYVPDQAIDWIASEIGRIVAAQKEGGLTVTFAVSLALSLWAMNNAAVAWFGAMNVAYGELEKRTTVGLYLRCFAFTLSALVAGIVMIGVIVLVPLLLGNDGVGLDYGGRRVTAPVLFLVVAAGASAIYRLGPSRRPAQIRWVVFGAFLAGLGWITAATLLSWYLSNVANYAIMYGSLGTVAALMFWLYISVYILMLGAWVNAEIEHQTVVDTTIGPPQPLGRRGAYVADTIGKRAL